MVETVKLLKCPHCGVLSDPKNFNVKDKLNYWICPVCKHETFEHESYNWIKVIVED